MKFLKYSIFKPTVGYKINIKRVIKITLVQYEKKEKNGWEVYIDWKWEVYQSDSSIFLFQSICIFIKFSNILEEGLWTCCGQCGVSSESYLSLAQLVLPPKAQLPLKHRDSGYSWEFKPLPLYLLGRFPLLSFAHTALGVLFCLWACHCLWVFLPCLLSFQTQVRKVACLYRLTFSVVLGEFSRHHWVCGESSLWLGHQGSCHSFRSTRTSQRSFGPVLWEPWQCQAAWAPCWDLWDVGAVWMNFVLPQLVLDCESLAKSSNSGLRRKWLTTAHAWWHLWYPSQHYPAFCLWYSCLPHSLLGLYNTAGLLLFSTH